MEHDNTIHTRITHDDDCCGCIDITEGDNFNVLMTCNECGKVIADVPIPHN